MKNHYYVDNAGNVQGPVSPQDLQALHRTGQISSVTQVCEEGTENWLPYHQAAAPAPSNRKAVKSESQPGKNEVTSTSQKTASNGITKGRGTILIILLLIGIGAPFWVFLKPTPIGIGAPFWVFLKPPPNWEYQIVEILAEANERAPIMGDNFEKLSYKTVPDFSSRLDSLGSQGWELVSVFLEHETAHPNFGKEDYVTGLQPNIRPQKLVLIFKRQKKL